MCLPLIIHLLCHSRLFKFLCHQYKRMPFKKISVSQMTKDCFATQNCLTFLYCHGNPFVPIYFLAQQIKSLSFKKVKLSGVAILCIGGTRNLNNLEWQIKNIIFLCLRKGMNVLW